jgi:putative SOS response-associated peptidase YedK
MYQWIIAEREYDRWLNVSNTERPPVDMLRPYDSDQMKAWKVWSQRARALI